MKGYEKSPENYAYRGHLDSGWNDYQWLGHLERSMLEWTARGYIYKWLKEESDVGHLRERAKLLGHSARFEELYAQYLAVKLL